LQKGGEGTYPTKGREISGRDRGRAPTWIATLADWEVDGREIYLLMFLFKNIKEREISRGMEAGGPTWIATLTQKGENEVEGNIS
jgi:hypothetical protein